MQVIKDCKGLYTVKYNGREWSINDTGNQSDHGSWRWQVYEYGKSSDGYFTGTFKEAKEIVAKYSI